MRACVRGVMIVMIYEVCHPKGNGYTRLTTVWSVSICRGVSLAGTQHQQHVSFVLTMLKNITVT